MDRKKFEGKRWNIVCGNYEGVERYAVDELYRVIQQYVPYILTVNGDDAESGDMTEYNTVFIGTKTSNRYIGEFMSKGFIKPAAEKEGYAIKVFRNPLNCERQAIIIAGADENGVLYGVRDFEHYYVNSKWYSEGYRFRDDRIMFTEELPEYETSSSPAIENRGLWTWGHVIYDYRRYFDNMSRWKMNIITIWNDYAPLNARQIAEYAHSRGIKVIWGYSWCWGEDVNPCDSEEVEKWTERVIGTYEAQYAGAGGDGIYFQTFTEIPETRINGASVSELVTNWVNHIAGRLLEKYPDLWIQFGLHATSIRNDFAVRNIDPRISITWEDAGSFPYSYDPGNLKDLDETLAYTSKISELRGGKEDFGIVVKGCTTLDWLTFEHQKGTFILGEAKEDFIKSRTLKKTAFWRYAQACWIKNLKCVLDTVGIIQSKHIHKKTIEVLVEDGMWETQMWLPVALCAESMWNPDEEANELIGKVSLTDDVSFA